MQSGIAASRELHDAFNNLRLSSTTQRGLIASIEGEKLVPGEAIPSSNDFFEDLNFLDTLLKDEEAAYVLLRRHDGSPDGYVAVTYVPDRTPVRQKMLFAATRLTLVRELGTERFRETYFTTAKQELTAEGWRRHEKHNQLKAPLTEEEQALQDVKEAEADASQGTGHRASHLSGHATLSISEEALRALKELHSGGNNFVQLKLDVAKETIELACTGMTNAESLSSAISDTDPRYTFFQYETQGQSPLIFIYTCPSGSKIKERMVYASFRAGTIALAQKEAGLDIAKKFEASNPSEITATMIQEEFQPRPEQRQGFSRPKRPGKR